MSSFVKTISKWSKVDVEWRIGSAHAFGVRGPGFDPTTKPRMPFSETLISLLSDNRLKNY
jgi:hypothetical protein